MLQREEINLAVARGQEEESQTIIQLDELGKNSSSSSILLRPVFVVVYIKYKSINVTGRSLLSDDRQSHIRSLGGLMEPVFTSGPFTVKIDSTGGAESWHTQ
jgi:hypothetical protein